MLRLDCMDTRAESMQRWERAEIERSSVEATLTPDAALRVSPDTLDRYAAPSLDTAFPLEYAYHLLGNVHGRRILDFGCGSGANSVLLANRGAHVWGVDISEDLLRLARRRMAVSGRPDGASFIAGSAHDLPFPAPRGTAAAVRVDFSGAGPQLEAHPLRPLADPLSRPRHLSVRTPADGRRTATLRDRLLPLERASFRAAPRADRPGASSRSGLLPDVVQVGSPAARRHAPPRVLRVDSGD